MIKQEKHRCMKVEIDDFGFKVRCCLPAEVERDGWHFCAKHDPMIAREEEAKHQASLRQIIEEDRAREARRDACEEASEELIAALNQCIAIMSHTGGMQDTVDRAKNAIAKATE